MKNVVIILCLLFFSCECFAQISEDKYSVCLKPLNLSNSQKTKIDLINQKYLLKLTELNANLLVSKMSVAQLKSQTQYTSEYSKLNSQFRLAQNELNELEKQKQEEISYTLGFFKRFKFNRCCRTIKQ